MSDVKLMQKYKLSSLGLQSVFRKLVEKSVISSDDLVRRSPLYDDSVTIENMREFLRSYPALSAHAQELHNPDSQGMVRNISRNGMATTGLPAQVGEMKTFVVRGDVFPEVEPFVFEAKCRWVETEEPSGEILAGFEITDITDENFEKLNNFIEALTFAFED